MPFLKKSLLIAVSAIVLSGAAKAQDASTVLATVGGKDLTLGQVIVMASQLPPQYQQLPSETLFPAVLDQLIRQTAIAQSVEDDLTLEDELVLEIQNSSYLANKAMAEFTATAVTEDAIQAAYDEQFSDLPAEPEFNAAHILVETEEEAQAIKAELDGGADFAELAKTKSTGPSGPNGGDLGWFGKGMMVKEFEDAVLGLEVGEISAPVQTQFGWHVLILNDARDKPAPALEQVRDQIAQTLEATAVEAELERIVSGTDITRSEVEIDPNLVRNLDLLSQ